jgi:hypothetical protein
VNIACVNFLKKLLESTIGSGTMVAVPQLIGESSFDKKPGFLSNLNSFSARAGVFFSKMPGPNVVE